MFKVYEEKKTKMVILYGIFTNFDVAHLNALHLKKDFACLLQEFTP